MHKWTAVAAMIILVAMPLAAAEDLWIHVRVNDGGESGQTVRVNLPLQLIEQILPMVNHEPLAGGKIHLGDIPELDKIDLQGILDAVAGAEDGEFVTIDSSQQKVRVAKEGDQVLVHVDEGDTTRVRLTLPMTVVSALASGSGEELDILAALRELGQFRGDLVTVEEDGSHVRIWIDGQAEAE